MGNEGVPDAPGGGRRSYARCRRERVCDGRGARFLLVSSTLHAQTVRSV